MARPTLATQVNDFLGSLNATTSFDLMEKSILRKLFRRAVGKTVNATQTSVTATPADVPGVTFNVSKGSTYRIQGRLQAKAGNATGGVLIGLTASGQTSPTVAIVTTATAAAAAVAAQVTAFGTLITTATAALMVEVDGVFTADGNGVLQLQFGQSVTNATAATLYKGSWLQVLKVG